ncbi:amidase domain-containing protein [Paenibacillus donghaensis]|uniref:amidase domain-containing protein n=1 Tax=Paenibacillus donghaensis TaxID=414771 RepID=UPI001883F344|nr:amidase domain-containing protein [Paenibacillus donghaensis]MBE9915454.1 amidase domain-containing protein [Paenibacillus donghaensis]
MLRLFLLISVSLIIGLSPLNAYALSPKQDQDKEEIMVFLRQLFTDRNKLLVNQQPETIQKYYVPSEAGSRFAYQMELKRAKYISAWAEKRGLRLVSAEPNIRIARFKGNGDQASISLVQSAKISYNYKASSLAPQSFGIGTRHALTVKKMGDGWVVKKEWYLDPLEENPDLIPDSPNGFPHLAPDDNATNKKGRYNRERAVAYANKYAGLAWGAGNNNRYNRKYKDYTSLGGDCTNFASQVLGDAKEGGGLPMSGAWGYWGGGSRAWVQTDAFEHFLLYSGYGRLIAKGTFEEITRSGGKHPHGAIAKLQPGDLIGYELKGDTDHFSIVVGQDENGYPLVNSHTADRYRVPFDLGWDQTTKYILIHIK